MLEGTQPEKSILLIHGVTYSSHEFDIDYEDYSLVRFLAREGYAVWRLDIAGFGQSGEVEDGFLPDSDYAAEDINAAVEKIVQVMGQNQVDLLGWSWGTVTASRFAASHSEHLDKARSLIDLEKITVPTLVICGDTDPYLNYDLVNAVLDHLPEGSELDVLEGGSHVVFIEKPYYREFQDKIIEYLEK